MTMWTVARLDHRGNGVAVADDGTQARAPLSLPGEVIEGDAIDGRITDMRIVTPSPARVRPACAHYRACGGCSMMHANDALVAEWKAGVVRAALSAQGFDAVIAGIATSPPRARRRAVLSGRRTKKGALVGFHARASDVVVDLADCHVMRPEITAALPLLRRIVIAGASRAGEVSMALIHGPAGLDVSVTGGKPMTPDLFQTLAALADDGDLARLAWDDQAITRRVPALPMGRAHVVPPAGAFLQATAEGAAALTAAVVSMTRGAARIADLFSGCGTFALPLSAHADVHAVEGLAAPLAALDRAWRGAPGLKRITTEIRDLQRGPLLPDALAQFDAIVMDPPRSGAPAQTRQIALSSVPKVVAVSCDPVSFAKDARILADAGYVMGPVLIVDQFRWSSHIEIVTSFAKHWSETRNL